MIETERRNHVATRNQRLAALHTFYRYIAVHHPEMLAEAERVEAIPSKRCPAPRTIFLEREEIDALFKALPKYGTHALRDRALLMILYNTGARVQEVSDLRVGDVDLDGPFRVRLHSKGDKWRSCPRGRFQTASIGRSESPGLRPIRWIVYRKFGKRVTR
jgi:integrase/recombinase XerD